MIKNSDGKFLIFFQLRSDTKLFQSAKYGTETISFWNNDRIPQLLLRVQGEKQTPPTADSVGSRGNKVGLTPAVLLRSITTPVGIAPMTIANSLGGIGIPYSLHQKFLI